MSAASTRGPVSPQEQREIDLRLQQVLKRSANSSCADCGAKHPRWASVNLGVVVCLECSGVHRKLGTHISKVKSATLDTWKKEWVDTLDRIGNEVANAFYEHSLPADFKRPTRKDDSNTIENWIRCKYEKKNYAPKGTPEPWELCAQGRDPREAIPPQTPKSHSKKSQNKEVPLLLPGGEDLGMLEPPAAAPAGACATAPAPSPPLSSEDMKVQAAKQAIARLYAEPASVGFNLGGQRVLQPEGLGAVDFFSSAQSQGAGKQQQQSGGAGWANWSSFAASPYPVAPAPASCVPAFGSFSSASISFPPQGFASAAAPPPPSAWIAGCAVDPWAEGSRMGGGGAASLGAAVRPSGFPQTQPSSTKSPPQEPLSALNSLDAFALARKVQQGGQSANPSPLQQASFVGGKEGGNLQTTFGASQGEAHRPAAAPAAQQDTLLLI